MAYGITLSNPTYVVGTHSGFVVGFIANASRNDFTRNGVAPGATDGPNAILNGGGNLRFYADDTKTTRWPCDIVRFVTGATPDCEVWVRVASWSSTASIYIEADGVETAQPAVSDIYGRNAVWSDTVGVFHGDTVVDSSGVNPNLALTGSASVGNAQGPLGGSLFVDANAGTASAGFTPAFSITDPFSLSYWVIRNADGTTDDFEEIHASVETSSDGFNVGPNNAQNLTLFSTGGNTLSRTGATALSLSTAQKIRVEFDQANNTVNHYLDGSPDGAQVTGYTDNSSFSAGSAGLSIGARDFNPGSTIGSDIYIDELRIEKNIRGADWELTETLMVTAAAAWGSSTAWADTGGSTFDESLTLSASASQQQEVVFISESNLTLSAAADNVNSATASFENSLILSSAADQSSGSQIVANESLILAASAAIDHSTILTIEESLTLAAQMVDQYSLGSIYNEQVTLGAASGQSEAVIATLEGSLNLTAGSSQDQTVTAVVDVTVELTAGVSDEYLAGATIEEALTLDAAVAQTVAYAMAERLPTPSFRVFRVPSENRIYVISAETRIFKVRGNP